MMPLDKLHTSYLFRLSLASNGNKQIALSDCQLEQRILIRFFILMDNLHYCIVYIFNCRMVCCGKKLIQNFLKIPSRTIKTLINGLNDTFIYLFFCLFKMARSKFIRESL